MVTMQEVDRQLKAIGVTGRFWGRPEMLELQHILIPGETIQGCINGRYEGGFATLVVTDQRILLIDKKLFHLSVEDLRYDMVSEVDYSAQLMNGVLQVCTPTKKLTFQSFKPRPLRVLAGFIQQRVIEIRQQFSTQPQDQLVAVQAPQPQFPTVSRIPEAPFIDPRVPQEEEVLQPAVQQQPAASSPTIAPLPTPQFGRNPYATTPLMIRRRIGRLGTIAQTHPNPVS